jgi:hypothetical protein
MTKRFTFALLGLAFSLGACSDADIARRNLSQAADQFEINRRIIFYNGITDDPKEWKWGRCHTPSEADAAFIVKAVNNHDELVGALEEVVTLYCDLADSGDAGFWDPEKVNQIMRARAALTAVGVGGARE